MVRAELGGNAAAQLRKRDRDLVAGCRAFDVHAALNGGAVAIQMQIVVVDVLCRNVDQGDVAREAAVVPPIRVEGRNAIGEARVIDGDHNEVLARMKAGRDVAVKIGKAAFVAAGLLPVDPGDGLVVGRPDVKKCLVARGWLVGEVALIPKQAFVVEERFMLRVPVAGNLQGGRFAEVVLDQAMAAGLRSAVEEEAILSYLAMEVIEAAVVWVDDVVPVSVETERLAMIGVDQNGGRLGLPDAPRRKDGERCGSKDTRWRVASELRS